MTRTSLTKPSDLLGVLPVNTTLWDTVLGFEAP